MKRIVISVILILTMLGIFTTWYYFYLLKQAEKNKNTPENEIVIYNWEDYLSPDVISDFENKFKVKIRQEYFDDSDIMISSMQSQPDKYDLVVAEDGLIPYMRETKLIAPLDKSLIPNIQNLSEEAKNNMYDRGNTFCIPYLFGYSGIIINKNRVNPEDKSMNLLFNKSFEGRIGMLNNSREVLSAALLAQGKSVNDYSEESLNQAKDLVLNNIQLFKGFYSPIKEREALINNEIDIGLIYSQDAAVLIDQLYNFDFFPAKEGALLWMDNLCYSRSAQHKIASHVFLNYLLEPENSVKNSSYLMSLMPVKNIEQRIPSKLKKTYEIINCPQIAENVNGRFEFEKNSKEFAKTVNELWSAIRISGKIIE